MHLLYIQTSFQKINITMTIYLIIEKIFIINSLRFKQLDCNSHRSFFCDLIIWNFFVILWFFVVQCVFFSDSHEQKHQMGWDTSIPEVFMLLLYLRPSSWERGPLQLARQSKQGCNSYDGEALCSSCQEIW